MAHLSLLISEHQTSSGVGLKLALSLLGHYSIDKFVIEQICMQYPIYDTMIQSMEPQLGTLNFLAIESMPNF